MRPPFQETWQSMEMGAMHSGRTTRLKQHLCFRVKGGLSVLYADAYER